MFKTTYKRHLANTLRWSAGVTRLDRIKNEEISVGGSLVKRSDSQFFGNRPPQRDKMVKNETVSSHKLTLLAYMSRGLYTTTKLF